jgi:NADH-quinone oxidoreductase subunit I
MSQTPSPKDRTRGVIALDAQACTSCMLCVRECPTWCITLEAHQEHVDEPGARRPRVVNVLDRFEINYAQCMYCGICVDACPHDALFWAAQETPSGTPSDLLHNEKRLGQWLPLVDRD